jgi:hypothetical protein
MKKKITAQDNDIDCGVLVCLYAFTLRNGLAVEKISPSRAKGRYRVAIVEAMISNNLSSLQKFFEWEN